MIYKTIRVPDHVATGQYWRGVREARGMKIKELAQLMGRRPGYLSDLENGRRPWQPCVEAEYRKHLKIIDVCSNEPVPRDVCDQCAAQGDEATCNICALSGRM